MENFFDRLKVMRAEYDKAYSYMEERFNEELYPMFLGFKEVRPELTFADFYHLMLKKTKPSFYKVLTEVVRNKNTKEKNQ